MTDKKISELQNADKITNSDFVPVVTSGNITKKAKRSVLQMQEGAGNLYSKIVSTAPRHYWTMEGSVRAPKDEITGVQSIPSSGTIQDLSSPFVLHAPRIVKKYPSGFYYDTEQTAHYPTAITVMMVMRPNTSVIRMLGNSANSFFKGWGLYITNITGIELLFGLGSSVLAVSSGSNQALLGQINVVFWKFDTTNGHKILNNDNVIATSSNTSQPTDPEADLFLFDFGGELAPDPNSQRYNGLIQDIAVWDSALSDATISEITSLVLTGA
jgi:hypothetical protein